MRRHPPAPANVARISVATSGTDFTALNAISQRSSGLSVRRDHITRAARTRSAFSWFESYQAASASLYDQVWMTGWRLSAFRDRQHALQHGHRNESVESRASERNGPFGE